MTFVNTKHTTKVICSFNCTPIVNKNSINKSMWLIFIGFYLGWYTSSAEVHKLSHTPSWLMVKPIPSQWCFPDVDLVVEWMVCMWVGFLSLHMMHLSQLIIFCILHIYLYILVGILYAHFLKKPCGETCRIKWKEEPVNTLIIIIEHVNENILWNLLWILKSISNNYYRILTVMFG